MRQKDKRKCDKGASNMAILVSGGAGYIGSHTCIELLNAGYDIVVADNYYNSCPTVLERVRQITGKTFRFYEADMTKKEDVERIFAECPDIDAVIQFAAYKAVGESCKKPIEYYSNNFNCTLNILDVMRRHDCHNFVFSSSATVYGDPDTVPITEDFPLHTPTSPYGATKAFTERILTDCCAADPQLNVALLRYFNPIGAHKSGLIGEDPNGIPNNLMPYIAKVAVGKLEKVHVFGNDYPTPDGTGVRDYIHVVDLARGHVCAIKKLETKCGLFICNLGTGKGYSVLDVLHAFEKACGKTLPYVIDPRRAGDIAECYADPSKAKRELGWVAEYGIEEMCADSWNWQSHNPDGYKTQA
jgi:UDP-glucose 4-epimerase